MRVPNGVPALLARSITGVLVAPTPSLLDERAARSISLHDAETRNAPAVLRGTASDHCRLRRRARRDSGIVLSVRGAACAPARLSGFHAARHDRRRVARGRRSGLPPSRWQLERRRKPSGRAPADLHAAAGHRVDDAGASAASGADGILPAALELGGLAAVLRQWFLFRPQFPPPPSSSRWPARPPSRADGNEAPRGAWWALIANGQRIMKII
jgi:hypothetical protein